MPPPRFTPVVVAALAVGLMVCAPQARRAGGSRGDRVMTQPASRSIVLRSSHILLVKVVAARPAAWAPFRPGLKSRKVELSVQVEEALRGLIDPAADRPVDVTVEQTAYDGELMMQPLQGSWSPVPIDPGTELVTFSESASGRAELVLEEQACKLVLPAEQALPGMRIAAQALA